MRNMKVSILAISALACLAACKKPEPLPPAPVTVTPAPNASRMENPAAPTPPPVAQAPTPEAGKEVDLEEARAALNQAMRTWFLTRPNPPRDLNELVAAKLISSIPPPPPGKKWVPDARTMSVSAK
jgi:hypothetical protein